MAAYFVLLTDENQVLTAPPLAGAELNIHDKNQHFSIIPGQDGVYLVSRVNGQVLDVTSSKFEQGNAVGLYTKHNAINQRFHFTSPGPITVLDQSKLNVAIKDLKVVLSNEVQVWTAIPVPAEHKVTFVNTGKEVITITFDNALPSEPVKSWSIDPNANVSITVFEGSTFTAKTPTRNVVPPTPYTVSKEDTIVLGEDVHAEYDRKISALVDRLTVLENIVKKQHEPKWIRVNANLSILQGEGLKAENVNPTNSVWKILFTTPRTDVNYTVVANVLHPEYWRTWPRVTNLTAAGFEVHFLTENKTAIYSDLNKNVAGAHPMELSCVVVEAHPI